MINKIKELGDNLKLLQGHDRLQYLVDKAKEINPLPEELKIEKNRIHGCASNLWIVGGVTKENTMKYYVDGESHITKGTAKLIIDIVNDEKQSEVAKLNVEDFTVLGIKELLTIQRQNGLGHLLDRIIKIANELY